MISKKKWDGTKGLVKGTRHLSFSILLAWLFWAQVLLTVTAERVAAEFEDEEMKCVCDGGCEHLRESDCPWGLTLDVCGCCFLCARGENEPCGGALGTCAIGLKCQSKFITKSKSIIKDGTCIRDKGICYQPEKRYGCTVQAGNCKCEERFGCAGEEMFLFDTEESCRTQTAFLIARRKLEPLASYVSLTDNCSEVQCPTVQDCPPDSYRLPAIIDSSHETCCPPLQNCHCNPGLVCSSPPSCPQGYSARIINSTVEPGQCCPRYEECKKNSSTGTEEEKGVDKSIKALAHCSFNGKTYESEESWTHEGECSECNCQNGVVSCKPIQCDVLTACTLVRAEPGSCCPVCVGCIGNSGTVHNNSDVWDEDACTSCECIEGRVKCHAAMCQTTCLNPVHIPGECCPRCNGDEHECPIMDCHLECPNGFHLSEGGCPTCKCNKCPSLADCVKECKFGFETNEKGCPICHCRRQSEVEKRIQVHQPALRAAASKSVADLELKCHGSWGELPRSNGEEWEDGCRKCVCKNGTEMCSLLTCPLPHCEHPVFYQGSCCPRCPGEHSEIFEQENELSICLTSDGAQHVDGETWKIGNCLTCTCHDGQILCAGPNCPPTPCPNSRIEKEGDCCLTCPSNPNSHSNDKNISAAEDPSQSNCFSDDSLRGFMDGEMWKVGPCQSCICNRGQVHCFGVKCLNLLECERPILAKNQCCPICLDSKSTKLVTSFNDLKSEDGGPYPLFQDSFNGNITTEFSVRSQESSSKPQPSFSKETTTLTTRVDEENSQNEEKIVVGGGLEPHCAIIITALAAVSCLLTLYIIRSCFFRRTIRLTKKISFHSSHSSSNTSSPPVTPDCCYKYTSCATTSSEQKSPLCQNRISSPTSTGHSSTIRNTNSILNNGGEKV